MYAKLFSGSQHSSFPSVPVPLQLRGADLAAELHLQDPRPSQHAKTVAIVSYSRQNIFTNGAPLSFIFEHGLSAHSWMSAYSMYVAPQGTALNHMVILRTQKPSM